MSLVNVELPSSHCLHFKEVYNDELRRCKLDFVDKMTDDSHVKVGSFQRKMTHCYDTKAKKWSFYKDGLC